MKWLWTEPIALPEDAGLGLDGGDDRVLLVGEERGAAVQVGRVDGDVHGSLQEGIRVHGSPASNLPEVLELGDPLRSAAQDGGAVHSATHNRKFES